MAHVNPAILTGSDCDGVCIDEESNGLSYLKPFVIKGWRF